MYKGLARKTKMCNLLCNTTEVPSNIFVETATGEINESSTQLGTTISSSGSSMMDAVRIAIASIHITVFFFGITGNGIILYTLYKVVKNRSVTDLYILSLAISDMLFVATLPFTATDMLQKNWVFGIVVCKIFVGVNYFVLCAGVLIVTAMSVDRFQNVVFAVKMMGVRTTRRAKIIIGGLWGFSIVYMVPAAITASVVSAGNATDNKICTLNYEDVGNIKAGTVLVVHTIFRFVVAFLVPFVIMVCCNVTIVHFLRKRRSKKKKRKSAFTNSQARDHTENKDHKIQVHKSEEDRITRLILLVTSVFLLCFLPNLILNTLHVLGPSVFDVLRLHYGDTMQIFRWSSVCLLYINSALNPFLYAYSGSGFRKRIKEALLGQDARRKYKQGTVPHRSPQATRMTPLSPRSPRTHKENRDPTPPQEALPSAVMLKTENGGRSCTVSAYVCYQAETDSAEPSAAARMTNKSEAATRVQKSQYAEGTNGHANKHITLIAAPNFVATNDNDSGFSAAFECDETDQSPIVTGRLP